MFIDGSFGLLVLIKSPKRVAINDHYAFYGSQNGWEADLHGKLKKYARKRVLDAVDMFLSEKVSLQMHRRVVYSLNGKVAWKPYARDLF